MKFSGTGPQRLIRKKIFMVAFAWTFPSCIESMGCLLWQFAQLDVFLLRFLWQNSAEGVTNYTNIDVIIAKEFLSMLGVTETNLSV